ncbi:MAG: MFS transporter [Gammaproteobacteria bacterium]|jgi:MFS family permease|nr:MFS transporter [Gammaproteobacteria bacterium]
MSRTLPVLSIAQAFSQTAAPVIVLLGGIVGTRLAPSHDLATLPVAFMIIGTAITTIPAALLMSRIGRKNGFMLSALAASLAGVLAAYAISESNFWLFCASTMIIGGNNAFVQQYRFAVAEVAAPDQVGKSLSILMLAGVVAAWMGPAVAQNLHDKGPWGEFSGSFLGVSALMLVALISLSFYENKPMTSRAVEEQPRALISIVLQLMFLAAVGAAVVGYGVMSLVMTATPVSMHTIDHFSLEDTTWVIQSHIMAMFLPSLFSGFLIDKFGPVKIVFSGLVLMAACLVVGYIERHLMHYWVALILLGVGWNFLFLGGTTLLTKTYTDAERFKVQAFNDFLIFSFQAMAALGSGYLLTQFGWNWVLGFSVPWLVALAVLLLVATVKKKI